jgi:SAM-dependent methyltransferase
LPTDQPDAETALSELAARIAALRLPDLRGRSVLDLGCGEGHFCEAAVALGARRVLGLDTDAAALDRARARVPGAEFRLASWWEVPPERFDVILCLRVIEEEPDATRLMASLAPRLAEDGMMIVETPALLDPTRRGWHLETQGNRLRRVPSLHYLTEEILAPYGVRVRGRAPGEPMRFLWHARRREPMVLVLGAPSGHGKTTLARALGRRGLRVVHTDELLMQLQHMQSGYSGPLGDYLRRVNAQASVGEAVDRMGPAEVEEVAGLLADTLSRDDDLTVIEGYVLARPDVAARFADIARSRGFRLHALAPEEPNARRGLPIRPAWPRLLRRRSG